MQGRIPTSWKAAFLLGLVAISSCSPPDSAGPRNRTTSKPKTNTLRPPAGIPSDAELVEGNALKRMLLGRALRPIRQPTNPSIGTERFQISGQWERFSLPLGVSGLPMLSRSVEWAADSYCVRPSKSGQVCSQIWRRGGQIFVLQKYPNRTNIYEAIITSDMLGTPRW